MKIGDAFASRLHEVLFKPEGFKKKARVFSRLNPGYGEHYNLQGSSWNSPDAPWRFYVNCGINFPDLPAPGKGAGLWGISHAHARLTLVVPDAPSEYDVTEENCDEVLAELAMHLRECFAYFARRHEILKDSFMNGKYHGIFLYDPELQRG